MGTLVVDFAALDRLGTSIDRSIDDAERCLDDLAGQLRRLADAWEGGASDGFQRTLSNWLAARHDLQQQLAYLRTVVATAHHNHASAVATNTTMWHG